MAEELIKILQEQIAEDAEVVAFTIILKKNCWAYAVTHDPFGNIYVNEIE